MFELIFKFSKRKLEILLKYLEEILKKDLKISIINKIFDLFYI